MTLRFGMSIATAAILVAAAVGQAQAQNAPQGGNAAAIAKSSSAASATAATTATPTATATPAAAATDKPGAGSPAAKQSAGLQASDDDLPVEVRKEALDDGFRPVTRGKATLYCKSEIEVGSAFPMRTCYNADRLKIVLQQYREQRMQLQQLHGAGLRGH